MRKLSENYLLAELRRVYYILGRTPKCDELKEYGAPNKTTYTNRFKSYSVACALAGIPSLRVRKNSTDDDLLNSIRSVYKKKKRPLTTKDFDKVKGLPSYSTLSNRFGGFCKACHIAGVPSVSHYNISKEEMLEMLKNLSEELGRAPISNELSEYGLPSDVTYRHYFKSYTHALFMAGVSDITHSKGNYRGVKSLAKDGKTLCNSLAELKITNYLIDNKIAFEKEVLYPNTKYRVDWKINDVYVEYFGLVGKEAYDRKIAIKRDLCEKENIQLIEIYPRDLKRLDEVFYFTA